MRATFCNFQKTSIVNNRPMGENSDNLVTLHQAHPKVMIGKFCMV
jgi:hypothetical protein